MKRLLSKNPGVSARMVAVAASIAMLLATFGVGGPLALAEGEYGHGKFVDAIAAVDAGGTVEVPGSFALEDHVLIEKEVTITGAEGVEGITISAGGYSIVIQSGGHLTMSGGLTLLSGDEEGETAAIFVEEGILAMDGSTISVTGTTGKGVVAGVDSNVTIMNGRILANGTGCVAVDNYGTTVLNKVSITAAGTNSVGVFARSFPEATVSIQGGSITAGDSSRAMIAKGCTVDIAGDAHITGGIILMLMAYTALPHPTAS